tara:strand:+ start:3186 stop:3698 length:513 start_codon:yes stop_codon:yes gene_type:complete
MKLGKCKAVILFFIFFYSNHSFGESISNVEIGDLNKLPSTYEEEEFVEEDNSSKQILQKVKYEENKKIDSEGITVEIMALDKITAKTSTLSIKLGEEKYFGKLKIKPLKCKETDIDQPPDTVAYLQVIDISDKKNDQVFVFNGWTFASSPTLRSLDHSIYDLWLLGCTNI